MSPRARPVLLFLLLLVLFPAAASVVRWWRGETLAWLEWAGVIAFPALAWLWWRHFSVMGCQPCQTPAERQTHPSDRADT